MAIDPGEVRVGVAVSDETRTIAQPRATLGARDGARLLREISRLARELEVREVIVGLPLLLDGSEGESAQRARRLGGQVAAATGLPVSYADERLTSVQAERELIRQGASRARRRQVGDRVAAALLLQGVLGGASARP